MSQSMIRPAVLLLAAALPLPALLAPVPAMAQASRNRDAGAEAFVQQGAIKVLGVLNNKGLSKAAKAAAFRPLINDLIDVPRVTRFVLGKYARSATPDQYARFSAAFRAYADAVYQKRIDDYHGEKVVVAGSSLNRPGDAVVTTMLSGPRTQPTAILWRVQNSGQGWKVIDVQVKGVWLAITQQQDFISTIDNAGGRIDVLTQQLQRDTAGEIIHKT